MPKSALELALKKLAIKAYSREEMEQVLKKAGFSCCETTAASEKLLEMGYLNDRLLAQDLYDFYTGRKPCGRCLIAEKLKRKGIPGDIIDTVLEDLTAEKEITLAHQLAVKYLAVKNSASSCRALAQYLERRGFSPYTVNEIIRRHCADADIYLYI